MYDFNVDLMFLWCCLGHGYCLCSNICLLHCALLHARVQASLGEKWDFCSVWATCRLRSLIPCSL